MAKDLDKHNIKVILVQTWEAHTKEHWTIGHPQEPEHQQHSLEDRINRCKEFINRYGTTYPVFVDKWDNEFELKFRAWPDKYHVVDNQMKLIARAEYGKEGDMDAMVLKDYTVLLQELMK